MVTDVPETKFVTTDRISCDGGEGALGHPRIWLKIPEHKGWIQCPYCDCRFILTEPENIQMTMKNTSTEELSKSTTEQ